MPTEFDLIQEFAEKATAAETVDSVAEDFITAIRPLGFETFALGTAVNFSWSPETAIAVDRFPGAWSEHYTRERYLEEDRIFEVVLGRQVPFTWDSEAVQTGLKKRQNMIFKEAEEAGMLFGLTVPIHSRSHPPAAISIAGQNADVGAGQVHAAHLMAVYLHCAVLRLVRDRHSVEAEKVELLSPRERECLRWVAIGKTNWEIGQIVDISENTVHYHVERAKRKLNVSTRTQAVVKAFFGDHISA